MYKKIALCFSLLLAGVSASAEDSAEYKKVGPWSVRVDNTGNALSCYMAAQFEGGSLFRFGFDMDSQLVYFIFGDDAWKSIEVGKNYDIEVKFGNESPWDVPAVGFSFDDENWTSQPFLYGAIRMEKEDSVLLLLEEFMGERYVEVYYEKNSILKLSLKHSYRAASEMVNCQEAVNDINYASDKNWSADPFEKSQPKVSSDPFAG